MDADLRKAERAEAKKNAPKLLPLEAGQKVMIAGDEWGAPWGRVHLVLDADRAEIRLDHATQRDYRDNGNCRPHQYYHVQWKNG